MCIRDRARKRANNKQETESVPRLSRRLRKYVAFKERVQLAKKEKKRKQTAQEGEQVSRSHRWRRPPCGGRWRGSCSRPRSASSRVCPPSCTGSRSEGSTAASLECDRARREEGPQAES
eukprot:5835245-Pyramimonas_sp.AAC.1